VQNFNLGVFFGGLFLNYLSLTFWNHHIVPSWDNFNDSLTYKIHYIIPIKSTSLLKHPWYKKSRYDKMSFSMSSEGVPGSYLMDNPPLIP
jgi:hypothetical protein